MAKRGGECSYEALADEDEPVEVPLAEFEPDALPDEDEPLLEPLPELLPELDELPLPDVEPSDDPLVEEPDPDEDESCEPDALPEPDVLLLELFELPDCDVPFVEPDVELDWSDAEESVLDAVASWCTGSFSELEAESD